MTFVYVGPHHIQLKTEYFTVPIYDRGPGNGLQTRPLMSTLEPSICYQERERERERGIDIFAYLNDHKKINYILGGEMEPIKGLDCVRHILDSS